MDNFSLFQDICSYFLFKTHIEILRQSSKILIHKNMDKIACM